MNKQPLFSACLTAATLVVGSFLLTPPVGAQQGATSPTSTAKEEGVSWSGLTSSQRGALAPLQDQWASLSSSTKEKWVGVARRMAAMSPPERERIQGRMASWASLTPVERGQTRIYFQEARSVAPEVRSEQWKRYNELSEDEKRQLSARALPSAATRSVSSARGAAAFSVIDGQAAKVNTTPATSAVLPQRIAPSVVQAQPGATTTLISSRPSPPLHQPAGMPKIGAAPMVASSASETPPRTSTADTPTQP
jgi:hypothetical protein